MRTRWASRNARSRPGALGRSVRPRRQSRQLRHRAEEALPPKSVTHEMYVKPATGSRLLVLPQLTPSQYTLPSLSPFKPRHAPSPLRQTGSLSGLTRSATTANLQRASSVASDVSMGRGSTRGLGRSGSMLFASVNGDREHDEDRMSVDADGERGREGSALVSRCRRQRCRSRSSRTGSCAIGGARGNVNLDLQPRQQQADAWDRWPRLLQIRQSARASWCGTETRDSFARAN